LYQQWNLKSKKEPDNLKYDYNARYYKVRYAYYKDYFAVEEEKDRAANALRYEVEEKKQEAEALVKQELEVAAFEKQENQLLIQFEAAKVADDRRGAIQDLLKQQSDTYNKAIEWTKAAATDVTVDEQAKQMAKKTAEWEQKKYITLKKEINQDSIKQEAAKEEAEKEANEAKEQLESAGIVLTSDERKALYDDIKEVTAIELTEDPVQDEKLLEIQLVATVDLAEKYKKRMITK